MNEHESITDCNAAEPVITEDIAAESPVAEDMQTPDCLSEETVETAQPKVNFFKRILGYFKTHKKVTFSILAIILIAVASIGVMTIVRSVQANTIEQAQIGKCYIVNDIHQNSYLISSYNTTVYYFTEDGVYALNIEYSDAARKKVTSLYGSLKNKNGLRDPQFEVDMSGQPKIFGWESIELDEQNQIITSGDEQLAWQPFTLEEGLALETYAVKSYEMYKLCKDAALGTEEFASKIRKTLNATGDTRILNATNSEYISAAKTLINSILKNPSSAIYNSESVTAKDSYGRGIVHLDVSAQNSFGGYVRSEYYVCIQSIQPLDRFTYREYCYYVESAYQIDYLKSSNDWDADPNADKDASGFLPNNSVKRAGIEVCGYNLEQHIFKCPLVTYIAYVEQDTQYVLAAEITISKNIFNGLDSNQKSMLNKALEAVAESCGLTYITSKFSKIFDTDRGILSKEPYEDEGLIYHAAEKEGAIRLSCTNNSVFGLQPGSFWTPVQ